LKETIDISALTITDMLEQSIEDNSDRIALTYNDTHVTYRELNARANNIAYFLIAKGVKPNSYVPICLKSGIDMIAGIIGILKTGSAYVPIDPDYPEHRISYVLSDCEAKVVVTDKASGSKLSKIFAGEIIDLGNKQIYLTGALEKNPSIAFDPESLAYIIYTSGTTGNPNGVMIEHRSVMNNLLWAKNYFKIRPDDIVLQKTTFCFDVSVWEIFWPLFCGAKLVIIDVENYKDVQYLKTVIELHKVTAVHFVPAMLEFFLLSIATGDCSTLNFIASSGEALTPFQANLSNDRLPGAKLYNLYGPTETSIHSTVWPVPYNKGNVEKILIGKPIDDTEIIIVNEQNHVQTVGSIGEIYIAGIGLARGYLNKPGLTAERFIKESFTGKITRYYKTGDFGRYLEDGNLEYLGRVDDQVKINGYRIELGSIEANIKNSGLVSHAVVLTRKNKLRALQIIVYVVLKAPNTIQDIWDYLVVKLPGYMLPTSIKDVQRIPFTANGKINKDRLFELGLIDDAKTKVITARNESERTVMSIWTELFPEIQLSIYHDFFEIGGNSMLAMKMLSQLKKETGKHISFLLLNQFPTIESLAKLLNKENLLKIPNSLVSIRAEGHKTPLYLINGGELVADEFFNLGDVLDENQPIYGFQSNGFDGSGKLLETIEEIATYYIKGILSQDNYGPYCLAGYSVGGVIAFEMARQLKAMGRTVKLLAMIDSITRDPWLIKTKYSGFAILRLIGFNIYLLKDGLAKALKYSAAFVKAGLKTISNKFKSYEAEKPAENNNADTLDNFDVFSLHVSAYKKYKLEPYDGNIVVFRAKELTYYMDDFKYLGWRRYSKKTRSVSVRGDHFSIFDDENIQELGAKFQKILDTGY